MAVIEQTPISNFTGNGVTTVFAFDFLVPLNTDLLVIVGGVTKTLGTDYTVAGTGVSSGGTVTFTTAPGSGVAVSVVRAVPKNRSTDYQENGDLLAAVLNGDLDRIVVMVQDTEATVGVRAVRGPVGESLTDLPPAASRANTTLGFDADGQPTVLTPDTGSAADVLTRLADTSDAAKGAALVGFSPALAYASGTVGYQLPWATFRGTGGNDTTALQALLTAGYNVQLVGTIYANNLTATTAGQHLKGVGRARVVKNANGPLVTFSAADQCTEGIEWRGDAATPVYTGANVVSTGENFRWLHSGSRWAHGAALVLQGSNPLVHSQMDIIQSSLLGSSYDIDCGLDGTARLYGRIFGVYTSQNTGGIRLTDVGSWSIAQSQFGALTVQSGGSGYLAGCNGGNYIANRINGNVSVGISSALFSANLIGGSTVMFESGTSGHSFDDSNSVSSGTTITDSSNASNVIDLRTIAPASYTPTLTGTGVSIGDATCTGQVVKRGRVCTATFRIVMGATTNFGSGAWSVSLPYIPATTLSYWGVARALDSGTAYYTGAINTSTSGVAEAQITQDGGVAAFNNARPFTWVAGDTLEGSITYVTAS